MRICKISIDGFKSIYNKTEIDFSEITGLWKISGDVGTGKTTIGEAIIYGLFGTINGKNNAEVVSWGLKKGFIEIWMESKGHNIYIKREFRLQGQAQLFVEVDGDELIFTNKRDAQGQLERDYYDTSRTTIELLCIVSFNNFKSISTLNTADTRKFLDQVFGFQVITKYSDSAKLFRQESSTLENKIQTDINGILAQIDKIEELSNKTKIEGNIADTESQISERRDKKNDIDSKFRSYSSKQNSILMDLKAKLSEIKTLGLNKKREIDFIKQGICPTCGAPIDQSQLSIKEQEKELLGEQYKTINEQYTSVESTLKEKQLNYNKISTDIYDEILELNKILTQLKEQESRSQVHQDEIIKLQEQIDGLNTNLMGQQIETEEWNQLYGILTNDMRSLVLENFIPLLNQNIAIYLSQLHQPYSIVFDNEFKCTVRVFGVDRDIPTSSLSTGQLKTIDMTIMLGVLSVIMSNVNFNIMFLDELMSNMDGGLRDTLCELLRTIIKPDQTIFTISHTELSDKWFDGSIYTSLNNLGDFKRESKINITKY